MNKQSAIAIFLVVIMVGSIGTALFGGLSNKNTSSDTNKTENASYVPINTIPGNHVSHSFNSIADGLAMSPEGITFARYVNFSKIYRSQLQAFVPNETQMSSVYRVLITKEFYAADSSMGNSSNAAFEMHSISPEVVNFQYLMSEKPYDGYYFLSRGNDIYNVVGSPMLLGTQSRLENILDVLSGNASSSHTFDYLLSKTEPGAEFQIISSDDKLVADQHYREFRALNDGGYAGTSLFLNLNQSVRTKINALAQNSSKRGLEYNITVDKNITKVVVKTNESNFFSLAMEPDL